MRIRVLAAAAIVSVVATGCLSTDAGDYKSEAESYIESDTFIEDAQAGGEIEFTKFSDANCEEPENTDPGTTYGCTAVNSDATTWNIEVEIREDNQLAVVGVEQQP